MVPRDFKPGERAEVDWAGGTIPFMHPKTLKIEQAQIFIGILGFSQLVFAQAFLTQKKHDFFQAQGNFSEKCFRCSIVFFLAFCFC